MQVLGQGALTGLFRNVFKLLTSAMVPGRLKSVDEEIERESMSWMS
jgi:hypothetical protein